MGTVDQSAQGVLGYIGEFSDPDRIIVFHAQHPCSNEIILNPGKVRDADRSSA
jgi:hypothetical protein